MAVEREDGDENGSGSEMTRTWKQSECTEEANLATITMRTMENSNKDQSSARTLKRPRLVWRRLLMVLCWVMVLYLSPVLSNVKCSPLFWQLLSVCGLCFGAAMLLFMEYLLCFLLEGSGLQFVLAVGPLVPSKE
ncbi:hypothetical protein Ddye_009718 [Dipteronia dyeriana]|uniref:Uncharacterized protein n=1 Tax=Dipteronia dyeriana TaxID=168575 RepID=A0AAE0CML3_9ROSI|nr:hypothetical protein Ddye_009718 [Dipteronia dyeriana]